MSIWATSEYNYDVKSHCPVICNSSKSGSNPEGVGANPAGATISRKAETTMNEIDEELATFIEKAISESVDYCEALDKVIEWQKKNRGLKGFHVSTPMDIMLGTREVEDPSEEAEKMAHDVLMMDLACARGQYKDVTNEEL